MVQQPAPVEPPPAVVQQPVDRGDGWMVVGSGDFNGDGAAEAFWRGPSDVAGVGDSHTLATMGGSAMTMGQDWRFSGARDVSGDGKSDAIWQHNSGLVYAWIMNDAQVMKGSIGPSDWLVS